MDVVQVLSILWWVGVLVAPFLIYRFVIRPRLRARFVDTYAYIDGFWARAATRVRAFKTFVVAALGAVLIALPDLLQQLHLVDFSTILPQPWSAFAGPAILILIALLKARDTTPVDEPPPGG